MVASSVRLGVSVVFDVDADIAEQLSHRPALTPDASALPSTYGVDAKAADRRRLRCRRACRRATAGTGCTAAGSAPSTRARCGAGCCAGSSCPRSDRSPDGKRSVRNGMANSALQPRSSIIARTSHAASQLRLKPPPEPVCWRCRRRGRRRPALRWSPGRRTRSPQGWCRRRSRSADRDRCRR